MIDVYITTGFDDKVVTTIPYNQIEEWLEDRERLCRAMGYETKRTNRLLHVLDKGRLDTVYFVRN